MIYQDNSTLFECSGYSFYLRLQLSGRQIEQKLQSIYKILLFFYVSYCFCLFYWIVLLKVNTGSAYPSLLSLGKFLSISRPSLLLIIYYLLTTEIQILKYFWSAPEYINVNIIFTMSHLIVCVFNLKLIFKEIIGSCCDHVWELPGISCDELHI